jgi:hypothetical protein
MGISTSWYPDTLEGLKSQLFVGIHRISAELPHSIELELKNIVEPEWIPAELPRSSYSEDSRQARKSSSPQNLTSLSTLQRLNLEVPWGGG